MNINWVNENMFSILILIMIFMNVVLILINVDIVPLVCFIIIQVILITLLAYSFGQELVNYSLLIIYGGGVMVIYMIFILFNRLYEFNKRYKEFNKTFFYLGFTVFLSLLVIMVLSKFIGIEDLKGMIIEESIDYNILWLED